MADKVVRESSRSFTIIYNDFIDSENVINSNEKLVYLILLRYGDKVFPSLNTISKKSGLSKRTVQRAIDGLIEKGIITKTRRYSEKNGGYTSNLYYVRDNASLWKKETSETLEKLEDTSEDRLIEEIKKRPGLLNRIKKELISTDQSIETSPKVESTVKFNSNDNTDNENCQEITEEYIKAQIDYDILLQEKLDKNDLDTVVMVMYEIYNSTNDKIRIGADEKPKSTVVSVISKLDYEDIRGVLIAYEQEEHSGTKIKNHEAYLRKMLYKAKIQNSQRLNNEGRNNHDW